MTQIPYLYNMEYKIVNVSESKVFASSLFINVDQKFYVTFSFNYIDFTDSMSFLDLKDFIVYSLIIKNEDGHEIKLDNDLMIKLYQELFNIISLEYKKEIDFISNHCTGKISASSYDDTIKQRDISNYPKLLKSITLSSGEEIEFRQTGDPLKYVLKDNEDNIVRDSNGLAMYLNKDQMIEKGLNLHDTSIIAFNPDKKSIALASDEWGADGIWVNKEYQHQRIGTEILSEFRKQFKDSRKIGQMTDAGVELTRAYYRKSIIQP